MTPEDVYPLVITDGKARFYLAELPNSVRNLYGKTITSWADYTVKVNGVTYPVKYDSQKGYYVDVMESSTYNAVLLSAKSSNYHGQNEYTDVVHPHSYAYHNAKDVINHLPHYASYSEKTGGMFFFSSALSLLEVTVKGSASLSSIKAENPAGNISGTLPLRPGETETAAPLTAISAVPSAALPFPFLYDDPPGS